MAILPYYVANLNIEATYAGIMGGKYEEYPNLCFVDTLDNVEGLGIRSGYQHEMFGALSAENVVRIRRQNGRKISVVIGNPPYNAWQENFNNRNPNRAYRRIDQRIKDTYVAKGTAQNINSVYDMYTRFFRWASDRLHDDGVLALITNRNFIEKAAFDGFRKDVASEFNEIYLMDLGGDVRANPKLSGTKHNVFGIQTGVTISLLVKRKGQKGCKVFYARRPEDDTAEDKLAFVGSQAAQSLTWQRVEPDPKGNWLNQTDNDWDSLVPLCSKEEMKGKRGRQRAIFTLFSNGVKTQRDEWVYDFNKLSLEKKIIYFLDIYEDTRINPHSAGRDLIKWDAELEKHARNNVIKIFSRKNIWRCSYRPFVSANIYFDRHINGRTYQLKYMFDGTTFNPTITYLNLGSDNPLAALATNVIFDLGLLKQGNGGTNQGVSRYRYTPSGERLDNITDWALKEFHKAYGKDGRTRPSWSGSSRPFPSSPGEDGVQDVDARDKPEHDGEGDGTHPSASQTPSPPKGEGKSKRALTKDDIFHYVYGVLHDPVYRETYAQNLKREFPRIPFYPDFWRWAGWGERLMALHIGYESVEPWPLQRLDMPDEKARAAGVTPKTILKADRDNGIIVLDSETQLSSVPPEAWAYKLGNRSGLDWVLDQHKEKTPKDPTIREKFNTYRFADYKEKVADLLMRVTRVSVETVAITQAMAALKRTD
ncbi:type ISP restriction/modification enzyme [Bosea sp. (in: a-proteobacteria)]|uniref:type ISP restriction/modification enzyme n=1 Tax=Bosea sp. (in: a-proteobacteria) TaxID=1871050 RepID=UPI003B3B886B